MIFIAKQAISLQVSSSRDLYSQWFETQEWQMSVSSKIKHKINYIFVPTNAPYSYRPKSKPPILLEFNSNRTFTTFIDAIRLVPSICIRSYCCLCCIILIYWRGKWLRDQPWMGKKGAAVAEVLHMLLMVVYLQPGGLSHALLLRNESGGGGGSPDGFHFSLLLLALHSELRAHNLDNYLQTAIVSSPCLWGIS